MAVYCIVVYDVDVSRVDRVHKFLRQYLFWIQNSVFEGELTAQEFREVVRGLKSIIDESKDSVVIYVLRDASLIKRSIIGQDKNRFSRII